MFLIESLTLNTLDNTKNEQTEMFCMKTHTLTGYVNVQTTILIVFKPTFQNALHCAMLVTSRSL